MFCAVCAKELRDEPGEAIPQHRTHPELEEEDVEHINVFYCGQECARVFYLAAALDRLTEAVGKIKIEKDEL